MNQIKKAPPTLNKNDRIGYKQNKKLKFIIMKNHIIYLLISVLILAGCKKYEEGPALSLRSKEKRLCQEWNLDKFTYNDEAITNQDNQKWIFRENGTLTITIFEDDSSDKMEYNWRWANDKEDIEILNSNTNDEKLVMFDLKNEKEEDWVLLKIQKLKFEQIILENRIEGDIVRFEFVK